MSLCRRLLLLSVVSASLASFSGCSVFVGIRDYIAYNDSTNRLVMGWRNDVWAQQSWHENKHLYDDQPYKADFGVGYRDGYAAVASGGNGCPPPLPPRKYWRWHYETPEGQAKIAAWFAGYPHGAAAAEQDAAGEWQEIPVSHSIEQQYTPEFENGTMFLPQEVSEQYYGPAGPAPASGSLPPASVLGPEVPAPAAPTLMHGAQNSGPSPDRFHASPSPSAGAPAGMMGRDTFSAGEQAMRLPAPPERAYFPNS